MDFNPFKPRVIKPADHVQASGYPVPCEEFSLTVMRGAGDTKMALAQSSPSICIVTEGEISILGMVLKQGESAFIPAAAGKEIPLAAPGPYTIYIASVP
jgi:mannose-6-phosphate isomerase class I